MIFRTFPDLLDELKVTELVAPLLGGSSHIRKSRIGTTLTVPVFMATGAGARTDLHCEPIGNLVLMLGGRRGGRSPHRIRAATCAQHSQRMGGRTSSRRSRQRTQRRLSHT